MTKKQVLSDGCDEAVIVRQETRLTRLALKYVSAEVLDETLADLASAILADKVADDDASIEAWLTSRKSLNDLWARVDIYDDGHLNVSDEEAAAARATPKKTYTPEQKRRTEEANEEFKKAFKKALEDDEADRKHEAGENLSTTTDDDDAERESS